jgi:hypothetical protein
LVVFNLSHEDIDWTLPAGLAPRWLEAPGRGAGTLATTAPCTCPHMAPATPRSADLPVVRARGEMIAAPAHST